MVAQTVCRAVVVTVTCSDANQTVSVREGGDKIESFLKKHDPHIKITRFGNGKEPRKNDVIKEMNNMISKSAPGDTCVIYFGCHGGYNAQYNYVNLKGGELNSFELREVIYKAKTGVRILVIVDACGTESMARISHSWSGGKWVKTKWKDQQPKDHKPLVLCISAVKDTQLGQDMSGKEFIDWYNKNQNNGIPFAMISEVIPEYSGAINKIQMNNINKKLFSLFTPFFYSVFLRPPGDTKTFREMIDELITAKMMQKVWKGKVTPCLTSNFKIDLSKFRMRDFFVITAGKSMFLDSDGWYKIRVELSAQGEKDMITAMGYDPDAFNTMHYILMGTSAVCFLCMIMAYIIACCCRRGRRKRAKRRRHGIRNVKKTRLMHPLTKHRRTKARRTTRKR